MALFCLLSGCCLMPNAQTDLHYCAPPPLTVALTSESSVWPKCPSACGYWLSLAGSVTVLDAVSGKSSTSAICMAYGMHRPFCSNVFFFPLMFGSTFEQKKTFHAIQKCEGCPTESLFSHSYLFSFKAYPDCGSHSIRKHANSLLGCQL